MCIRDRWWTFRFRLFRKPLFLTCSILPLLSLKHKKPLSEIQREDIISIPRLHQQAHMRGSCQPCLHTAHNGKPRKTAPAQPGPVSYTHLDVYKRQHPPFKITQPLSSSKSRRRSLSGLSIIYMKIIFKFFLSIIIFSTLYLIFLCFIEMCIRDSSSVRTPGQSIFPETLQRGCTTSTTFIIRVESPG